MNELLHLHPHASPQHGMTLFWLALAGLGALGIVLLVFRSMLGKVLGGQPWMIVLLFMLAAIVTTYVHYPSLQARVHGYFSLMLGDMALQQQAWQAAESDYEEALHWTKDKSAVYVRLGDVAMAQRHTADALNRYQQALDANARNAEARLKLARLEQKMGNAQLALQFYQDALEDDSENTDLQTEVADVYYRRAQADPTDHEAYHQVERLLKKVLHKQPDNDEARFRLAEAYFAQDQFDDAIPVYCDLVLAHPDSAEANYSLGVTMAKAGDNRDAFPAVQRAAELIATRAPAQSQQWARMAIGLQLHLAPLDAPIDPAAKDCARRLRIAAKQAKRDATP